MRRFRFSPASSLLACSALLVLVACAPEESVFGNASSTGGGASVSSSAGTGDDATSDGPAGPGSGPSGTGAGSGQGGDTTVVSSSSAGGGGAAPECDDPGDCDDPDGECAVAACDDGVCGVSFAERGTPLVEQDVGDCRAIVCDGEGATEAVNDDQDLVDDGNACTIESCVGGELRVEDADEGTPCGDGGALFCDDAGQCVGCSAPEECPGIDDECQKRRCDDGVCGVDFRDEGTPLEDDEGNCLGLECDGEGNATPVIDDGDIPVDGNDCTRDVCSDGEPSNPPRDEGDACGGGGVCDGDGACVECVEDSDCGTDTACAIFDCTNQNTCDSLFADPGDPAGDPDPNDCLHDECGAQGAIIPDVPDDAGDSCPGGNVCDGAGSCVECLDGGDCPSGICNPGGTCAECGDDGDCNSDICRCQICRDDAWIFFSQYVEGTNNDKALEIYNATSEDFDLGAFGCEIRRYANGSSDAHTTYPLDATIGPGETLVVCNTLVSFPLSCDELATSALDFNGDDTVVLACEDEVQDAIGRLGEDPGTEWGSGNPGGTADASLTRKQGLFVGDLNASNPFNPSTEWDASAAGSAGLGEHDPCGG